MASRFQTNFSTGAILDPTRGAQKALSNISDLMMNAQKIKDRRLAAQQAEEAMKLREAANKRAQGEYDQKVQDRNALLQYSKGIAEGPQQIATLTDALAGNEKAQANVDAMTLTPEELKATRGELHDPALLASANKKLARQESTLGQTWDTNSKNYIAPQYETRSEMIDRVASGIDNPTPAILDRIASAKAAEIEANRNKLDALTAQQTSLMDKKNELDLKAAKEAGNKYKKTGSSGKNSYGKDILYEDLNDYENKVTLGGINAFGLTDADDVKKFIEAGAENRIPAAVLKRTMDRALSKGTLGNNFRTKDGESQADALNRLLKDEQKRYDIAKAGTTGSSYNQPYHDKLLSESAGISSRLAGVNDKLRALSTPSMDRRLEESRQYLEGLGKTGTTSNVTKPTPISRQKKKTAEPPKTLKTTETRKETPAKTVNSNRELSIPEADATQQAYQEYLRRKNDPNATPNEIAVAKAKLYGMGVIGGLSDYVGKPLLEGANKIGTYFQNMNRPQGNPYKSKDGSAIVTGILDNISSGVKSLQSDAATSRGKVLASSVSKANPDFNESKVTKLVSALQARDGKDPTKAEVVDAYQKLFRKNNKVPSQKTINEVLGSPSIPSSPSSLREMRKTVEDVSGTKTLGMSDAEIKSLYQMLAR